jgi:hypothetical protein
MSERSPAGLKIVKSHRSALEIVFIVIERYFSQTVCGQTFLPIQKKWSEKIASKNFPAFCPFIIPRRCWLHRGFGGALIRHVNQYDLTPSLCSGNSPSIDTESGFATVTSSVPTLRTLFGF